MAIGSEMDDKGSDTPKPDYFEIEWLRLLANEHAIHEAKKKDYTGDHDPLYNYQRAAEIMGVPTKVAMLGRLMEKVTRLSVIFESGEIHVKDETIEDTCIDISVIAKLIAIESLRESDNPSAMFKALDAMHRSTDDRAPDAPPIPKQD